MTKTQNKIDLIAEDVIKNNLKSIKKRLTHLENSSNFLGIKNLDKLSGTNQFGEPYYLIAKRLGYNELSEFLYKHTSEKLINREYLTSPVQVLYNLIHMTKKHTTAVHKALEEYAFHPVLAKLLIPIALNNLNQNSLSIIDTSIDPQLKKSFDQLGLTQASANHFDFSKLIDFHLRGNPIPAPQNSAIIFYNKTGATSGIAIHKFKDSGPQGVRALLAHELLAHEGNRILFKDAKTVAPYGNQYGKKCSKEEYVKIFSIFKNDLKFIHDNKEEGVSIVEKDGEELIIIDKTLTPNGNKLIYTDNSLFSIFAFLSYEEHEHPHGEAIAFYVQNIAMEAPYHHTTAMDSMDKYYDTCIAPAIEEFVSLHPNCPLIQGIGACSAPDSEL